MAQPLHSVKLIPSAEMSIVAGPMPMRMHPAWYGFLANGVANPTPMIEVILAGSIGPSPYNYVASSFGFLLVRGGTVSAIGLTRGKGSGQVVISPLGMTSGFIPASQGDIITITYTVKPALWFIPTGATT